MLSEKPQLPAVLRSNIGQENHKKRASENRMGSIPCGFLMRSTGHRDWPQRLATETIGKSGNVGNLRGLRVRAVMGILRISAMLENPGGLGCLVTFGGLRKLRDPLRLRLLGKLGSLGESHAPPPIETP